jgi:hypothetical protein
MESPVVVLWKMRAAGLWPLRIGGRLRDAF